MNKHTNGKRQHFFSFFFFLLINTYVLGTTESEWRFVDKTSWIYSKASVSKMWCVCFSYIYICIHYTYIQYGDKFPKLRFETLTQSSAFAWYLVYMRTSCPRCRFMLDSVPFNSVHKGFQLALYTQIPLLHETFRIIHFLLWGFFCERFMKAFRIAVIMAHIS